MGRDTKQELHRLEKALLEENEEIRNANFFGQHVDWKAYNTDRSDEDLERYSEAVRNPPKRKRGLAALLLLGLLAVIWLVLRHWGNV